MDTSSQETDEMRIEDTDLYEFSFEYRDVDGGVVSSILTEEETRERLTESLVQTFGEKTEILSMEKLSGEKREGLLEMLKRDSQSSPAILQ